MTAALPTLSVVVAAWRGDDGVAACLESLEPARAEIHEAIVVAAGGVSDPLRQRFPWVTFEEAPECRLIPRLWGQGMARGTGDLVAITTTQFVAEHGWAAAARAAQARSGAPALGGPITLPDGAGMAETATYFLRYSGLLRHRGEGPVAQLAGDNAAYRREVLPPSAELSSHGFWEVELHQRLVAGGPSLLFVPGMRLRQHGAFGVAPFLKQRFRHGRQFGGSRARHWLAARRLAGALALPLIPAVLLARIARNVSGSGLGARLLACLPALALFLGAWAAGEALGYLAGDGEGDA